MVDLGVSPYTGNKIANKIVIQNGKVVSNVKATSSPTTTKSSNSKLNSNNDLTPAQKEFYDRLPASEKNNYLTQVSQRTKSSNTVTLTKEQADFQNKIKDEAQRVEYARQVSTRNRSSTSVTLNANQAKEINKLPLSEQRQAVERLQAKASSSDKVEQFEYALGRSVNPVERAVIRTGEFTTADSQKRAIKRAGQTYNLAGRQLGNVFVKGQPFTDNAPATTRQDKFTKAVTSPAFVFGAPLAFTGAGAVWGSVGKAVAGSRTGTLTYQLTGATARSVGVAKGTTEVGRLTAGTNEVYSKDYKEALAYAYSKEAEAINKKPFYKGLAYDLSPAFGDKSEFTKALRAKGFTETQINTALRERRFRTTGEAIGLLEAGRSAESAGRTAVKALGSKVAGKGVVKTGLMVAPSIGIAGFQEGFTSSIVQQQSRAQNFNAQNALGAGAIGAVTAGALGGTIGGFVAGTPFTATTAKRGVNKGTGKAINLIANIIDPLEKPSDILQDITESVTRRGRAPLEVSKVISVRQTKVLIPQVRVGGVKTVSLTSVKSNTKTAVKTQTTTKDGKVSVTVGRVPNYAESIFKTINKQNNKVIPSRADTGGIKPFVPVPVEPKPIVPVEVPTNVPVTIPAVVPIFRLPPPLPLSTGSLGNGYGSSRRRGSTFIDEFSLTLNALGFGNRGKKRK